MLYYIKITVSDMLLCPQKSSDFSEIKFTSNFVETCDLWMKSNRNLNPFKLANIDNIAALKLIVFKQSFTCSCHEI